MCSVAWHASHLVQTLFVLTCPMSDIAMPVHRNKSMGRDIGPVDFRGGSVGFPSPSCLCVDAGSATLFTVLRLIAMVKRITTNMRMC